MIQNSKICILEPTGMLLRQSTEKTPRLDSLEGKTVAALWNNRPDGDVMFPILLELLKERYGVKETKFFEKGVDKRAVPVLDEWLIGIAKQADAFVTGIGD